LAVKSTAAEGSNDVLVVTGLDAFVAGGITLPVVTPITTPDRIGDLIEKLAP
jgi:hypothetical protein